MAEFTLDAYPIAESYRLLDFESVEVIPGIVNDTYFLRVTGTKPCVNMEVTLTPRIYLRCPEYWGIEVVGSLPSGICLEALGKYDETIPLAGVTGSQGMEVIGAAKSERREVPGGCRSGAGFTGRRG